MAQSVAFQTGDATALPCKPSSFDVVTMALVLFFLSDPVLGIAEMKRVVKSEGTLAAYVWDISGDGLPTGLIPGGLQEIQALKELISQSLDSDYEVWISGHVYGHVWLKFPVNEDQYSAFDSRQLHHFFEFNDNFLLKTPNNSWFFLPFSSLQFVYINQLIDTHSDTENALLLNDSFSGSSSLTVSKS